MNDVISLPAWWMDERMDRWMDRLANRWIDGWMDGWMDLLRRAWLKERKEKAGDCPSCESVKVSRRLTGKGGEWQTA